MNRRFATILKSLKLPVLTQADITMLQHLQRDWEGRTERLAQLQPRRIAEDRKAAFETFLENPTPENEQRLAVLADSELTAKRHQVLSEAHTQLRLRTNGKAADLLRPLLERIHRALDEELQRREAQADAMEVRASRDPRCQEMNWAIEHLSQGMGLLMRGTSLLDGSVPPLEMASVIMPGREPVPAN